MKVVVRLLCLMVVFAGFAGTMLAADLSILWRQEVHRHVVNAVAFSPDGRLLASVGSDGRLSLLYAGDGSVYRTLRLADLLQERIADERGDRSETLVASPSLHSFRHGFFGLAFAPQQPLLATSFILKDKDANGAFLATREYLFLWNFETNRKTVVPVYTTAGGSRCTRPGTVAYSADGERLAFAGDNGMVTLMDGVSAEILFSFDAHKKSISALAFAPDGRSLATSGGDKKIRLWDPRTGAPLQSVGAMKHRAYSMRFSDDGSRLYSAGYDKKVRVWDPSVGSEEQTVKGHHAAVRGIALSKDRQVLMSAALDKTIQFVNTRAGEYIGTYTALREGLNTMDIAPDGRTLVVGTNKGRVYRLELPFYMASAKDAQETRNALGASEPLLHSSPNPISEDASLEIVLPASGHTTLEIHNTLGETVSQIWDHYLSAGAHVVRWDARDIAAGVYYASLQIGELKYSHKLIVVK